MRPGPLASRAKVRRMSRIGYAEVAHVASLARLALSPGEIEAMTRDLEQILAHVASLDTLDTEGISPTLHGFDLPTPLRPDRPAPATERTAPAGPRRLSI